MSFYEYRASYDLSFNSESHLHRLVLSVPDPSWEPLDGPTLPCKATWRC
jgi:hypothetical protein